MLQQALVQQQVMNVPFNDVEANVPKVREKIKSSSSPRCILQLLYHFVRLLIRSFPLCCCNSRLFRRLLMKFFSPAIFVLRVLCTIKWKRRLQKLKKRLKGIVNKFIFRCKSIVRFTIDCGKRYFVNLKYRKFSRRKYYDSNAMSIDCSEIIVRNDE